MSCIFCQIIKKEIKSEFIFENENMVVFKDINPKAPMHLLLVPKKHLGSLNALSE